MLINSRSNTRIKHLKRLQQRKHRQKFEQCIVEGSRLVAEASKAGFILKEIFIREDLKSELRFSDQAETFEVSATLLASISQLQSPPDCIGVFDLQTVRADPQRLSAWLLCENVQDPGNFGALLRLADAMHWQGVLALGDFPDPFQGKVIRSSMASCFRVPVTPLSLTELRQWQAEGWSVLASTLQAKLSSLHCQLPRQLLLAVGHEGQGLSADLIAQADLEVKIPMQPAVDSLNIATAAAMLMHEYNRQTEGC